MSSHYTPSRSERILEAQERKRRSVPCRGCGRPHKPVRSAQYCGACSAKLLAEWWAK